MIPQVHHTTVEAHISDLSQRIARLETGGKNSNLEVAISPVAVSIAPDDFEIVDFSLVWDDTDITVNPHGVFYFSLYQGDINDPDNLWPLGSNVDTLDISFGWGYNKTLLDATPNGSHATIALTNFSASNIGCNIVSRWVYLGGSGGTTAS